MIEELKKIELNDILDILNKPISEFKTLYIDYHKPYVERLQYKLDNNNYLSFHIIHQCESDEALYHPHSWPSAIHVLDGNYEMGLAYSTDIEHYKSENANGCYNNFIKTQEICKLVLHKDFYYEMNNKNGWHYVRPISAQSMSVMLMGEKWYSGSKPTKELFPLSSERADMIKEQFKLWYYRHYNL